MNKQVFDLQGFQEYLFNEFLFFGALNTVGLTVAALIGGLVLGTLLAMMRMSPIRPLSWLAQFYIWLFRGTPLLVQLLIIFTAVPLVIDVRLSVLETALLGLILNEAAYLAEIIRSGILAVPKGQTNAGKALGLTPSQVMRYIVMPQAARIIIPPLGNSVNGLLKTTSITSVISMEELLRRTQILIQEKFLVLELFAVAALYYLILTTLWDLVQRRIEARFGKAYSDVQLAESY
ncbi:amino acid ABC transporter permease [Bauldia sp.]|uniref:amino acid ABC transporter permease n=1 Tax=Bauldia sp. TaxID=2575872 RepID=UPI003BA88269